MSKKDKEKEFKFTFQHLLRISIFLIIIFLLINTFSSKIVSNPVLSDPTVLGEETTVNNSQLFQEAYQLLPENSRQHLETLNQNPAIIFFQQQSDALKEITKDFPEKQIKELKKALIKNIYDDLMRSIEEDQ